MFRNIAPILATLLLSTPANSHKSEYEDARSVLERFGSCDYFLAQGVNGLFVLKWVSGANPYEGDIIFGELEELWGVQDDKTVDVNYNKDVSGKVLVVSGLETASRALEKIKDLC